MLPVFELRGSIPIGINYFDLNPLLVFTISIVGNMVPIFFVLLFLDGITKLFYKVPILRKFLEFIFRRTHHRSSMVEKYQELGLVIFVAIPLPITGAWTGSFAAYLFGLKFWKSIFFIFCGVLIAGIVVTILSLLGWIGAIIALTVLLALFLRKAMTLMNINNIKKRNEGAV
ncbi:MAG: small multi-drug export protein [Candidatus Cloacimonetes bacterium]|nr:small multi-drug export protein [Candidatus Cloacimonadota bacterium]